MSLYFWRPPFKRSAFAAWAFAAVALGGCAASLPPITLVQMPVHAEKAEAIQPLRIASSTTWQLVLPLGLPQHLDHANLWVTGADKLLRRVGDARWSEPLPDALVQRLQRDLSERMGREVWVSPLPSGVSATRQLRVTVLTLDWVVGQDVAVMDARWSLANTSGARAPVVFQRRIEVLARKASAQDVAIAYRQLVSQLSAHIATSMQDQVPD